jgi:hypothetical protein
MLSKQFRPKLNLLVGVIFILPWFMKPTGYATHSLGTRCQHLPFTSNLQKRVVWAPTLLDTMPARLGKVDQNLEV